jgi:GlpG protein
VRQIGTIADEKQARRLADYLLTQGITTRLDRAPNGWEVWVHREEKVEQARDEIRAFLENPEEPKYQGLESSARALRKQAAREEREHRRQTIYVQNFWATYRPLKRCPWMYVFMGLSIIITLVAWFSGNRAVDDAMFIARAYKVQPGQEDPRRDSDYISAEEGEGRPQFRSNVWRDVRRGEAWRLVSPIFLHFDGLHLLFNMMWLYDIGGQIEIRRGSRRFVLFVIAAAVASNLAQYFYNYYPFFGGFSGVNYAFLGYLWMKGQYEPESGMGVRRGVVTWMLVWLVACMTGTFGDIANAAHVAGLLFGVLIGILPHLLPRLPGS